MTAISEAVVLMAGEGSRLRGSDKTFLKPFVPVLGRPLISYALDALIRAGITSVNFVVGYESGRMIEQVKQLIPSGLSASFIENRHWQKESLTSGKNCAITMPLISGCLFAHSKSSTISNERSPAVAETTAAWLMEFD